MPGSAPALGDKVADAGWDGRGPTREPANPSGADTPPLANAELVQLQVRVIALENLLIALLSEASDSQLRLARDMATYISPRPGYTPHTLTLHAATQMLHLIERGELFNANARAAHAGSENAGDT